MEFWSIRDPAFLAGLAALAAVLIAAAGAFVCFLFKRHEKREILMHRVERLIESCGGDVDGLDRHGLTPLMRALATADDDATVRELLRRGANPDGRNASGCTPMMMAADLDRAACIATLIRAGAQDQALDPAGRTALMRAVLARHPVSVAQFALGGTELNARDPQGKTALMLAVEQGQTETVRALLEAGAQEARRPLNLSLTDGAGHTALSLAEELGHGEMVQMLRREADRSLHPGGQEEKTP